MDTPPIIKLAALVVIETAREARDGSPAYLRAYLELCSWKDRGDRRPARRQIVADILEQRDTKWAA